MNDFTLVIVVAIAVLLFLGSVILRSKTKAKYEIKNIDLIIATLPIVIWLLVSNKLDEVNFLGVGIKMPMYLPRLPTKILAPSLQVPKRSPLFVLPCWYH